MNAPSLSQALLFFPHPTMPPSPQLPRPNSVMASVPHGCLNSSLSLTRRASSVVGILSLPFSRPNQKPFQVFPKGTVLSHRFSSIPSSAFSRKGFLGLISKKGILTVPRSSNSSNSNGAKDESSEKSKASFGYSRKDVLLIGLGVTIFGITLESGLEFLGVDPLQAGNVVQLVLVLGLTIGWISTYIFRVSNKEMTYAQQLRDYEVKVMEKRLEGLTEAELEALLEQVEEEKRRIASGEQVN